MNKKESDKMPVSAPAKTNSKRQRIFAKAKENFEDKRKVDAFISAGGSLNTDHKFDVKRISNELRGKE